MASHQLVGSGHLLPPSPPTKKSATCQDQAGKSSTGDGAGNGIRDLQREALVRSASPRSRSRCRVLCRASRGSCSRKCLGWWVKRVPEVYPVGTPSKIGTPAMFVLCARTTGGPLLLVARVVPPDPKLVGPEIPL